MRNCFTELQSAPLWLRIREGPSQAKLCDQVHLKSFLPMPRLDPYFLKQRTTKIHTQWKWLCFPQVHCHSVSPRATKPGLPDLFSLGHRGSIPKNTLFRILWVQGCDQLRKPFLQPARPLAGKDVLAQLWRVYLGQDRADRGHWNPTWTDGHFQSGQ